MEILPILIAAGTTPDGLPTRLTFTHAGWEVRIEVDVSDERDDARTYVLWLRSPEVEALRGRVMIDAENWMRWSNIATERRDGERPGIERMYVVGGYLDIAVNPDARLLVEAALPLLSHAREAARRHAKAS